MTIELIDRLLDAERYTKVNIQKMCQNLNMAEENEHKLACASQASKLSPLKMAFGPTSAPSYIYYCIDKILLGMIGKDTAKYLVNIMEYTTKCLDHIQEAVKILEILSKHDRRLKPEKCEFSNCVVKCLLLVISQCCVEWTWLR